MTENQVAALQEIHKAFIGLLKRAEKNAGEVLTSTFVDSAPLLESIATRNSQVIYGRRGTGKTHALKYLGSSIVGQGGHPIYIDLRSIGSNRSLYTETSRPPAERAIGLILDVLGVVADELYAFAVARIDSAPHPDQVALRLDDLALAISEVKLDGEASAEQRETVEHKKTSSIKIGAEISKGELGSSSGVGFDKSHASVAEVKSSTKGREQKHISFGKVQSAFESLLVILGSPQVWLLIDEWSEVPIDLQPFLADLIRRTLLPLRQVILKIAAIEHRSTFFSPKAKGEYIGMELGADIAVDVNLDDFLVFDNDQRRSVAFFKQLLFSHYHAATAAPTIKTADELIRVVFTQAPVFEEFVRAAEGVPRDAINLAAKLGSKFYGRTASMVDVRSVARDWYLLDKAAVFKSWPELDQIMTGIVEEVIGQRRARAFLFESNAKEERIDRLFDSRIIHVLKRNISSKDDPGKRFTVYKIDYGCYVDLINTRQSPLGLFEAHQGQSDQTAWVEVPTDDYRSIRRAILSQSELESFVGRISGTKQLAESEDNEASK